MQRKEKGPRRRAIEQFFVRWLARLLVVLVRAASPGGRRRIARCFAGIIRLASWPRRRLVLENISRVLGGTHTPEQQRLILRRSVYNIAKTAVELIALPSMSDDDLKQAISVEGLENLDAALARGHGVIIVTGHFGNWELASALLSVLGYPINVVAREATDAFVDDVINESRSSRGANVFGRWSTRQLLRALKSNECVAILPDQHAKDAPIRLTFLGRPADTAGGPATFALRTGAAIVPVFAPRGPDEHINLTICPPLDIEETDDRAEDVARVSQQINDIIGEQIYKQPEQWLWLHDRWKAEHQIADTPNR